jgi:hypothetical protein
MIFYKNWVDNSTEEREIDGQMLHLQRGKGKYTDKREQTDKREERKPYTKIDRQIKRESNGYRNREISLERRQRERKREDSER